MRAGPDVFGLQLGPLDFHATAKPWTTLAAGASASGPISLTMPCTGSSGVGETLDTGIVFTATTH